MMRSYFTEHAVWHVNYGTRGKHAIRKGMQSVAEKFVSATNLLLVPIQQIIGDGLVIGKVILLQEKRGGHVSTGRACLVTLVDRKSRFAIGGKADKKNAREVSRASYVRSEGFP